MATIATAPKFSMTSRVAILPPGIRTWSARNAKIFPTYKLSDEVVSNSCSPTGNRFGLRQRRLCAIVLLAAVGSPLGHLQRQPLARLVLDRRADEAGEQRMRSGRPALEFGMGLGADEERVHLGRILDELDQVPVRSRPGEFQAAFGEAITAGVVDLIAMPMPLGNLS